jgi:hypothetical protein
MTAVDLTHWLLTHQPFLISLIAIHGMAVAVSIAGLAFVPRGRERAL